MEEDEIDLLELFGAILKRWKILLLVAVLCGAAGYAGTKLLIKPTYRSFFTAYINNSSDTTISSDTVTNTDIQGRRNLANTYAQIIQSKPNVEAAMKSAGVSENYAEIAQGVSVSTVNNTEVIRVSVITNNPETSYHIASALEECSPDYVANIVNGSSMMVVSHAELPSGRYSPSYKKNAVITMIIGLFIACFWIVILYLRDNRVKSPEDLTGRYGLVVIGTIHDLASHSSHGYYEYEKGGSNG